MPDDATHGVEPDPDGLMARYETLGPRVRLHFNRACATVRIIEMGYRLYGHALEPQTIVRYIRQRVYDDTAPDAELETHLAGCRECRRLLRRHRIRKAVLARLGLSVADWSG